MLDALGAWEPGESVVLRSPMAHRFRAAGATFERRGAWSMPVAVAGEQDRLRHVGVADASSLGKFEVRGGEEPAAAPDRQVLEVSPDRWIVLCAAAARSALAADLAGAHRRALDMTGAWALLALAGPQRERLLRRLGPVAEIPGAGPVAGVPGRVFERANALWVLVASEFAQHVCDLALDIAGPLSGGPVGLDVVARGGEDPLLGSLTAGAAR